MPRRGVEQTKSPRGRDRAFAKSNSKHEHDNMTISNTTAKQVNPQLNQINKNKDRALEKTSEQHQTSTEVRLLHPRDAGALTTTTTSTTTTTTTTTTAVGSPLEETFYRSRRPRSRPGDSAKILAFNFRIAPRTCRGLADWVPVRTVTFRNVWLLYTYVCIYTYIMLCYVI